MVLGMPIGCFIFGVVVYIITIFTSLAIIQLSLRKTTLLNLFGSIVFSILVGWFVTFIFILIQLADAIANWMHRLERKEGVVDCINTLNEELKEARKRVQE